MSRIASEVGVPRPPLWLMRAIGAQADIRVGE
jgi:hypothetical protein